MKGRQAAGIDGDFRQLRFILSAKQRSASDSVSVPLLCPGAAVEEGRAALLIAYITAATGVGERERTRGRSYCTPALARQVKFFVAKVWG